MNYKILWFILLLCSVAVANGAPVLRVKFAKSQTCPSDEALNQLANIGGTSDMMACFVECAVRKNCSVLFRSSSGVCFFGSPSQLSSNFSASNTPAAGQCESYLRTWQWPDDSTGSSEMAPNLNSTLLSKLIIFFDFRKSFTNLVNPSKYNAAPYGSVTRDSQGANFPGVSGRDYIEVDTDGRTLASTYLAHAKKFSFYARLYRQGSGRQTYHYFYDCATNASRGEFYDDGSRLRVVHPFPNASSYSVDIVAYKTDSYVLSSSSNLQLASMGATFNGNSLTGLFSSGSFKSRDDASATYNGPPLCLRLGYHNVSSYALIGQFICYTVANDTLSQSELQELEAFCGS